MVLDLEREKQRAVAALAAGRTHVAQYSHPSGWIVRTHRAPIVKNSELSTSAYSHGAWRRELGLTLFAGQHLPGSLYGGNSLELYHAPSGLRISFCALEALRAWVSLDLEPVPHLAPHVPSPEWDYTFTTAYAGAVSVAPLGVGVPAQPDGRTFYARAAVDLASGEAKLRRPLCKCKGTNGRAPLLPTAAGEHPLRGSSALERPPVAGAPPEWEPTQARVDVDALLRACVAPPEFADSVDLVRRRGAPALELRS